MTDNGTAPAPPDEDRTPTQSEDAPPVKPADAWVMPQPVFRSSGGFTPRVSVGNEDPTITPDSIPTIETEISRGVDDDPSTTADAPGIAEQPEETFEAPIVPGEPPVKKKSGVLRFLLMILGISVVALVIGAAITMVVLWYFFQVSESQNLN